MTLIQAQCLGGAVRVQARAPSLWMAHCHCSQCQRAHGAAYVTWIGLRAESCTLEDRDEQLRWYASSPAAERGFCARCGSSLLFRSQRWPGELHLTAANLTSTPDRTAQAHVFWDTHASWASIGEDGLPRRSAAEIG